MTAQEHSPLLAPADRQYLADVIEKHTRGLGTKAEALQRFNNTVVDISYRLYALERRLGELEARMAHSDLPPDPDPLPVKQDIPPDVVAELSYHIYDLVRRVEGLEGTAPKDPSSPPPSDTGRGHVLWKLHDYNALVGLLRRQSIELSKLQAQMARWERVVTMILEQESGTQFEDWTETDETSNARLSWYLFHMVLFPGKYIPPSPMKRPTVGQPLPQLPKPERPSTMPTTAWRLPEQETP